MAARDVLAALSVRLTTDATQFGKGLDQAKAKMNLFQESANMLKGALVGALSVYAVTAFAKSSIEAYNKQIQAEISLLTALKGRKDIQKDLLDQAKELQGKTLFGDEETIQAQSALAQLLGTNENAIKKLTPLVLDLAVAQKMDLRAAAALVAKSVGSSTNALSRYGIVITGAVGSSERLQSAVDNLNKTVGGQAEAAARVGTGAWKQLSNIYGDVIKEQTGALLINSQASQESAGMLKNLLVGIGNIEDALKNSKSETNKSSSSWLRYTNVIGLLWEYNKKLLSGFEKLTGIIKDHTKAVDDNTNSNNNNSGAITEQLSLLADLQKKLKNAKDARDKSITTEDFAKNNRLAQQYQDQIDKLMKLGLVAKNVKPPILKYKVQIEQPQIDIQDSAINNDTDPFKYLNINWSNSGFDNWMKNFQKWSDNYQKIQQENQKYSQMFQDGLANMAESFAESLGTMAAGGKVDWGSAILTPIADMLSKLGKALITTGVGVIAFKNSLRTLQGPIAIAAGVALVALAAAMKQTISNIPSGGAATPAISQMTPSYGNTTQSSLRHIGDRSRQTVNVVITGKIKGQDIYFVTKRATQQINSTT